MKNIFFLCILFSGISSFGQDSTSRFQSEPPLQPRMFFKEKPFFEFCAGLQLYKFNGLYTLPSSVTYPPYIYVNELDPLITATLSCNIPVRELREHWFLGLNPNISVGYAYGIFVGDLPVYATLKYGAGATKYSENKIGFGAGAGMLFSGFTNLFSDGYFAYRYSGVYATPGLMGEISFQIRRSVLYQIRVDFTPLPKTRSDAFKGNISQYNLRIIRRF